jgi:hypothetical protein
VFSISGFTARNYYVQIGATGSGNAEIIKIHATTAPSGTTVTLAANTANTHDAGEPVYFLLYNQYEFSNASTVTGSKVTTGIGLKNVDPTKQWTICLDGTNTSGYAFVRPYNVGSTTYGSYSAAAPYANAAFNTVEYMIYEAMDELGLQFSDDLTPDLCLKQVNEGLRNIRMYRNRLSWTQSFNYATSQTSQGVLRYALPSDIYDKYSPKAVDAVRLGSRPALRYVDPNYFFNVLLEDVPFTQVRTAASAGDTTLEVDNSYDFDDSGSVYVAGNTITYTGVTRSATAGVLTGVPASGTGAIPAAGLSVDDWVLQGETESEPEYWTMLNGYLYLWPLPDSSYDNFNLAMDYYKTVTAVDSLDDAVDYIQYDMLKHFLKWKLKSKARNNGVEDLQDPSYMQYREMLTYHIGKDRPLNKSSFRNAYELQDIDNDINPRQIRDGSIF